MLGRNKENEMQKRFSESTWDSVEPLLSASGARGRVSVDGETVEAYIVFSTTAESLGITDKTSKQSDYGKFVESVKTGAIACWESEEALDKNELWLIPAPESIPYLDEYDFATGAAYKMVALNDDGEELVRSAQAVTYASVKEIIEEGTLVDAISEFGLASKDEVDTDDDEEVVIPRGPVVDTESENDVTADEGNFEDDDAFDGSKDEEASKTTVIHADVPLDEPDGDNDVDMDISDDDIDDSDVDTNVAVDDDFDDDFDDRLDDNMDTSEDIENEDANPDTDDDVTVTYVDANVVKGAMSRVFSRGDLTIDVDVRELDNMLDAQGDPIYLDENREVASDDSKEGSWLNRQLNDIARTANAEIKGARERCRGDIKKTYMTSMADAISSMLRDLDPTSGSIVRDYYSAAEAEYAKQVEQVENEMESYSKHVEDILEADRESAGNAARERAFAQFDQEHKDERDHMVDAARERKLADVECAYQSNRLSVDGYRASVAARLNDGLVSEASARAMSAFADGIGREDEIRAEAQKKQMALIEQYRKDDIARTTAILEEQARSTKIAQLEAQQRESLESLRHECADKLEDAKRDRERLLAENASKIEALKDAHTGELALKDKNIESLEETIEDYKKQMSVMGETYKAKYDDRLKLKDEELESSTQHNKRMMIGIVCIAIVCAIASFAVGMLLGVNHGIDSGIHAQPQITQTQTQTNR